MKKRKGANMWEPKLPLALLSARGNFGSHMLGSTPSCQELAFILSCVCGGKVSSKANSENYSLGRTRWSYRMEEGPQLETLPQPFPTRVAILAQDTSWRL